MNYVKRIIYRGLRFFRIYDKIIIERGVKVMLSPLTFSNNFIKRALDTGVALTPMKLQKLLYLLYARYYYLYQTPLFADQFEKWPYGPVLSEVYTAFKEFKSNSIDSFYRDHNSKVIVASECVPEFKQCFDEVWIKYGAYNGIYLSGLTHHPDSAWSHVDEMGDFLKLEDIIHDGCAYFK